MFLHNTKFALPLLLLLMALPIVDQKIDQKTGQGTAPGNPGVISANVNLVNLPVSVTDSHGQFVSGLTTDNFRVYEDNHAEKIAFFEDEDMPAAVGLVVDHSGSMRTKLPEVGAAAITFAQSSNPKDEMFVVDFNDISFLELPAATPFTSDVWQLEKAVMGVSAQGRTALYDAIIMGLNQLHSAHLERQALIIVSDGGDNASKHKLAEVVAQAQRSKAIIYAIGIISPDEGEQNPVALEKLAKATGGKAYFPHSVSEVTSICSQIARDIREQYTLGYTPSNSGMAGAYRKVEVKVIAPNQARLHVRTRDGYVVPPKTPSARAVLSGKL